jgi:hypothetical protein
LASGRQLIRSLQLRQRGAALFHSALAILAAIRAAEIITHPRLPASLDELRIHNLDMAEATVDLLLIRREYGVSVNALRREGNVQITVIK